MRELAGRTALVTGATGGIGHHVAERLASEGMRVCISARGAEALERLRTRIASTGGAAVAIAADLTMADGAATLAARAEEALGPVDVLVNNAGIEGALAYTDLAPADIDRYVALNLTAPMLLIRELLPGMLERGRGHVVNLASIAGKGPFPYEVPYATTKAALIGLTRSLRAEFMDAPVGFSAVCPGYVAGEGMYARIVTEGLRAPRAFAPCRMEEVIDAVVTAIREDRPEVIVARRPMRPLIALNELFPRLGERVVDWTGLREFTGALARRHATAQGTPRPA